MDASQVYILISVLILLIILIFVFFSKKKKKRLTPLAGIAFAFVLAGILFGGNRIASYGLMGIGIILSIIDVIKNKRK
jgi:uncharacterized membrane protein